MSRNSADGIDHRDLPDISALNLKIQKPTARYWVVTSSLQILQITTNRRKLSQMDKFLFSFDLQFFIWSFSLRDLCRFACLAVLVVSIAARAAEVVNRFPR